MPLVATRVAALLSVRLSTPNARAQPRADPRAGAGQSFTRRERCADVMAQMKAASLSLYFLHRDFDVCARPASDGSDGKEAAPGVGGVSARNVSVVLKDLMRNVRCYLMLERPSPDTEHDEGVIYYNRCVADFSSLSVLNERLSFRANYANGAMNRANEYLRGACPLLRRRSARSLH